MSQPVEHIAVGISNTPITNFPSDLSAINKGEIFVVDSYGKIIPISSDNYFATYKSANPNTYRDTLKAVAIAVGQKPGVPRVLAEVKLKGASVTPNDYSAPKQEQIILGGVNGSLNINSDRSYILKITDMSSKGLLANQSTYPGMTFQVQTGTVSGNIPTNQYPVFTSLIKQLNRKHYANPEPVPFIGSLVSSGTDAASGITLATNAGATGFNGGKVTIFLRKWSDKIILRYSDFVAGTGGTLVPASLGLIAANNFIKLNVDSSNNSVFAANAGVLGNSAGNHDVYKILNVSAFNGSTPNGDVTITLDREYTGENQTLDGFSLLRAISSANATATDARFGVKVVARPQVHRETSDYDMTIFDAILIEGPVDSELPRFFLSKRQFGAEKGKGFWRDIRIQEKHNHFALGYESMSFPSAFDDPIPYNSVENGTYAQVTLSGMNTWTGDFFRDREHNLVIRIAVNDGAAEASTSSSKYLGRIYDFLRDAIEELG